MNYKGLIAVADADSLCYGSDHCIDDRLAIWHNREYHPYVKCPVCGGKIINEEVTV